MYRFVLVATFATFVVATTPTLADSTQTTPENVGFLLSNVCLPYVVDRRTEDELSHDARLHETHMPYWPQIKPRGLRQYSGPYAGINAVNINSLDGTCQMHATGDDYAAFETAIRNSLSRRVETWVSLPSDTDGPVRCSFCSPGSSFFVNTFEGDPTRVLSEPKLKKRPPSFEVLVFRRAKSCGETIAK